MMKANSTLSLARLASSLRPRRKTLESQMEGGSPRHRSCFFSKRLAIIRNPVPNANSTRNSRWKSAKGRPLAKMPMLTFWNQSETETPTR